MQKVINHNLHLSIVKNLPMCIRVSKFLQYDECCDELLRLLPAMFIVIKTVKIRKGGDYRLTNCLGSVRHLTSEEKCCASDEAQQGCQ